MKQYPIGIRYNNPGNLRTRGTKNGLGGADPWQGLIGEDPMNGFGMFGRMADGVRAAAKDLRAGFAEVLRTHGRDGEDTVSEIITEWAPSTENDTAAYIKAVCKATGYGENEVLNDDQPTIRELLKAIFHHENGGDFVDPIDLANGVEKAFT